MKSTDPNLLKIDQTVLKSKKVGIIKSLWNIDITNKLYTGAVNTLLENNIKKENIITLNVPGSFELIFGAKKIIKENKLDGAILIGSIIQGETPHFNFISSALANGVKDLNILFDIPFIFCVSTDLNHRQALERAGGKFGNKGTDCALTLLQLLSF